MNHLSPLLVPSSNVVVTHAKGCYVYDASDTAYLDFTSGIGVTATGHCHPHVVEAVKNQSELLFHGQYATVQHPTMLELADRLAQRMPDSVDSICFSNAGTEAVETAIRLARQATGRPNVICFQGGFHGRTMGSASLTTSNVKIRAGQQPMMGGVVIAPFPHHQRWGWSAEAATRF
ncbi:MAG: aminotransferase class III-fold pyridoxal phosphate-dependent enzyme, partial [Gammaproteobacteria bacterium]